MSNPNGRKKIIKTVAVIVVICAIGGILYSQYIKNQKKAKEAMAMQNPDAVQTEPVSKQNVSSVISASGTVEAEKVYSISLSNNQEISKVLVNVGDKVSKDQTLIEYDYLSAKEKLDKSLEDANISLRNVELGLKAFNVTKTASEIADLEGAIITAEKNLYQAELDLTTHKNSIAEAKKSIETAQRDIEYAQVDIDNAQRELETAQKDLESNKQLLDIGAISQSDYDKFQTACDSKETALNNVKKAYDDKVKAKENTETNLADLELKTKTYELSIETAKFAVEKANRDLNEAKNPTLTNDEKIRYEQQKLQVESSKIKIEDIQSQIDDLTDVSVSPIDGVIIEKNVEDGDIAKETEALLKVADVTKLKVSATVSEFDASSIKLGQTVNITSDGIRDKVYTGKIIFIDPQAKKSGDETGVTIDASIENSDDLLKPGFSMDIEILTGEANDALAVPITSILTDEQSQKYVFMVTPENTLKKTIVTTGVYGDMYVEVKSGLSEGDKIVSSPVASMKDGDTITVAQPQGGGDINAINQEGAQTAEPESEQQ